MLLLLVLLSMGLIPLHARGGEVAPKARQITASHKAGKDWMKAMEASVGHSLPGEALSFKTIAGWTGWAMAFLSFAYVFVIQWRARKRTAFLMRAGERDHILIRRRP